MTNTSETEAELPEAWVRRYLDLLGLDHDTPSLPALTALTRAHILAIPFENYTSLFRRSAQPHGAVPPLDPDALLNNWEHGRGGGVCYEIASMATWLLQSLGYSATVVLGQISIPGGHQAIRVELGGERFLLDVGCGGPIFEPVPLDRTVEVRRAGLAYRFRPGDTADDWVQDRWIEGAWKPHCRYSLQPPTTEEREAAYQHHQTPGASWVLDRLRIVRVNETEVFTITGEDFTHYTADGKRSESITDPEEYARLTTEVFRLPGLSLADARQARATLNASLTGA